jgi:hypothetical protein
LVFDQAIFVYHQLQLSMKIFTKRVSKTYLLLIALSSISFIACKKQGGEVIVKGEAKLKVINAVQTESKQEVYIDNQKVTVTALAFGEMSDYLKIPSGNRSLTYMGTNNVNTDASMSFTPSLTYSTFLVSDRTGNRQILSYEDNISNSFVSSAKIRLINLTPYFVTGINVSVEAGTQFVNGLMFKEASNYFALDAGTALKFNVVGSGSIKTIEADDLQPGKTYTIWFSGITASALEAHIVVNN